uniref:Coiled-coil domain-containing protein 86 n=1 Tax=Graphocephala atropunctata TaxID=36148 RepID=A0A1B6MKY3_9HEMI
MKNTHILNLRIQKRFLFLKVNVSQAGSGKRRRRGQKQLSRLKVYNQHWKKRKKMQEEIKIAKQLTRDTLNERKQQKEEQRQRRILNLKRKKENLKKSEIVQVIKNPSKVKKKHLRMIEKRDTLPFLNKPVY